MKLLTSMVAMVKKKAGQLLSKVTGGLITTVPTSMAEAKKMVAGMLEVVKQKAGKLLSKLTGGLITTVPTSQSEAMMMMMGLFEIVKKKAGQLLYAGGHTMLVAMSRTSCRWRRQ